MANEGIGTLVLLVSTHHGMHTFAFYMALAAVGTPLLTQVYDSMFVPFLAWRRKGGTFMALGAYILKLPIAILAYALARISP